MDMTEKILSRSISEEECMVALNKYMDNLQRSQRSKDFRILNRLSVLFSEHPRNPEELLLEEERQAAMRYIFHDIMDSLNKKQRLAFWLYFIHGVTLDYIGQLMGISRQGVSIMIIRAQKKILERYSDKTQIIALLR